MQRKIKVYLASFIHFFTKYALVLIQTRCWTAYGMLQLSQHALIGSITSLFYNHLAGYIWYSVWLYLHWNKKRLCKNIISRENRPMRCIMFHMCLFCFIFTGREWTWRCQSFKSSILKEQQTLHYRILKNEWKTIWCLWCGKCIIKQ